MNENDLDDLTHPLVKPVMYSVIAFLCTIIITFGGCSMHSNTFDGERLQGQAEIERTLTERSIAEANARKEEVLAIERLVNTGINPVAARCAVKGWANHEKETCLLAGAK